MTRFPTHRPATGFPRPAVFLDRDDTINVNGDLPPDAFPGVPGDLFRPEHLRLLPGAREACLRLREAGYAIVVVTNQGCVARGHAEIVDIERTNDRLRELLGPGVVAAAYAAVHHPDSVNDRLHDVAHPWRKDGPGMLLAAARELHLDLARSWMVGDKERDRLAGVNAGLDPERCIRIGPDQAVTDLISAVERILAGGPASEPAPAPTGRTGPAGPTGPADLTVVPAARVELRAKPGEAPLADLGVRETVAATAHAIAERTGVTLLDLKADERSVTAILASSRLAAIGFMAELRRSTNTWHAARHEGRTLWPAHDNAADHA